MKTYEGLLETLKQIKAKGYIKTHRKGDTGIGKTLEDLLGIPENNIPGPDGELIELKSGRKDAKSMLTLITKTPLPEGVIATLLKRFGYISSKSHGKPILHSTITALKYNTIRKKKGFKIKVNRSERKIEILHGEEVVCYWDRDTLKEAITNKLPRLLYVKADVKGSGIEEEFLYNEAWLLSGFNFDNFVTLVEAGKVKADLRIGVYPEGHPQAGRPHDHGTGFRVASADYNICFSNNEKII